MTIHKHAALAASLIAALQPVNAFADYDLDQGWSYEDRRRWYDSSQGSRLIPLSWFDALEQADAGERFLSDRNVAAHGYRLRDVQYKGRIYRLPLGFAIDDQDDRALSYTKLRWLEGQDKRGHSEPWVGMTCAACHTLNITYKRATVTVEGAPTMADFQSFFSEFRAALARIDPANPTKYDDGKFNRFANAVLDADERESDKSLKTLGKQITELRSAVQGLADLNAPPQDEPHLQYGPGRLDAVGNILNKIAWVAARSEPSAQPTANAADAPVSYPFLWNVHQLDRVEWNGMAGNGPASSGLASLFPLLDVGALGRNIGQAIGVFGDLRINARREFVSSIRVDNLEGLEQSLRRLRPPRWPEAVFGPIDAALRDRGKRLFLAQGCASCHAPLERTDLTTKVRTQMVKLWHKEIESPDPAARRIATDPWMACNAFQFMSDSGLMKGMRKKDTPGLFADTDGVADMLAVAVVETLKGEKWVVTGLALRSFLGIPVRPIPSDESRNELAVEVFPHLVSARNDFKTAFTLLPPKKRRLIDCYLSADRVDMLAYKARPLNGIWATAPYLHNGSVPTLYDLLSPVEAQPQSPRVKRPDTFLVGTTEFDPRKVGYVTQPRPGNTFKFKTMDEQDQPLYGNQRTGHIYGADSFTDEERYALIEYMKSL